MTALIVLAYLIGYLIVGFAVMVAEVKITGRIFLTWEYFDVEKNDHVAIFVLGILSWPAIAIVFLLMGLGVGSVHLTRYLLRRIFARMA